MMESTSTKYIKTIIIAIIDFLLKADDYVNKNSSKKYDNTEEKMLKETTIDEKEKLIKLFITEKKIFEKENIEFISDLTLLIKLLNICIYINNSKEMEKYMYAIYHIELKSIQLEKFKENFIIFTKELTKEFKNRNLNIKLEAQYKETEEKLNSIQNQMDIDDAVFIEDTHNLKSLLKDIFELFKLMGFKNKFLNKTSCQFLKYFFNFITVKNVNEKELKLENSDVQELLENFDIIILSFLFYNPYIDIAISLIEFMIEFINKINDSKLESALKLNNMYSVSMSEDRENIYTEFLINFCKKSNLNKIFDIDKFLEIKFLKIKDLYFEAMNERDICLVYFINSYKRSYLQYSQKVYSNPENIVLFEKLKSFEIYQEKDDSIFFFPKMYKYCKLFLSKDNKMNSVKIKIENDLLNKISKFSRLDLKFSHNLLNLDYEKYINKNKSLFYGEEEFINEKNGRNPFRFNQLNFEFDYFHKQLLEFLIKNFKLILTFPYDCKNQSNMENHNPLKKEKIFDFDKWIQFYLENPYYTFLITYKYLSDFFLFEKSDFDFKDFDFKNSQQSQKNNSFFDGSLLNILSNEDSEDAFNYYDIYESEKLLIRIVEKIDNQATLAELFKINLKLLFTQYAMLETDMLNYSILMRDNFSTEEIHKNLITYKCELMNLIWSIKLYFETISDASTIQSEIDRIFSDIIVTDFEAFRIKVLKKFDKSLIKFLIEKIEPSCICEKYLDEMLHNKDPLYIINGLHLLGYWATCYPIIQVYERVIREIDLLKNIDLLRSLFIDNEKIFLFLEGLFLISKAFPKKNEFLLDFFNFLKNYLENIINDYDLLNDSKIMIEKSIIFIENNIINSDYNNVNNCLFKIN